LLHHRIASLLLGQCHFCQSCTVFCHLPATNRQETTLPTPQSALPVHGKFAPWPMPLLPTPQHIPPTLGNVVPWLTPTLTMPQLVPLTLSNIVPPKTLTPPMLQRVLPTLGIIVPQPILLLPMPQYIQLPHGNIACWQETSPPTLQHALSILGDVSPHPMLLLPALQRVLLPHGPAQLLPAVAAYQQGQQAHSILAYRACGQEQPHVAVAVQSIRQARFGGGGGKATRGWFVRPSSFNKRLPGICVQHAQQEGVDR
jgi:hypothetical protein